MQIIKHKALNSVRSRDWKWSNLWLYIYEQMKIADKIYIFWKIFNLALFIESQGDMIHRYHAEDKPVLDFFFYSNRIYLMQGVILILSACNSSENQGK